MSFIELDNMSIEVNLPIHSGFWPLELALSKIHDLEYVCRLCVIAGDISPIDVITHVPVLCEEADVPYIYVPSKEVIIWSKSPKLPVTVLSFIQIPLKL